MADRRPDEDQALIDREIQLTRFRFGFLRNRTLVAWSYSSVRASQDRRDTQNTRGTAVHAAGRPIAQQHDDH